MARGNFLDDLEQRMDELRQEVLGRVGGPTTAPGMGRTPAVDVEDRGDRYGVVFELPGVRKEDIQLRIDDQSVHLYAQKEQAREEPTGPRGFVRRERSSERFERTVTLPEQVSADGARATFRNGVLHVDVPKTSPEKQRARQIEIE